MIVNVYPVGTISYNHEGKEISEMFDMHNSGAIAFSDDKKPIKDSGLMIRALQYVQGFGGLIMSHPNDTSISHNGMMNESNTSTMLGLVGIPEIAEEIMVERDLALTAYTNGKLHFSTISTAKSVALIRAAKKKGLKITAEISANNLVLDDTSVESFDSNFKLEPPLRNKKDIKALIKGVKDGTIDTICSDHCPEDVEEKDRYFQDATPGIIGLETCFSLILSALGEDVSIDEIVKIMSTNPREILGLPLPTINVNERVELTLFDPKLKWTYNKVYSKSKNTPFLEQELMGRAIAIFNGDQVADCN